MSTPSDPLQDEGMAAACRRLLRGIRVVRRFRPDAIPDGVVEEILDVARWTGSAKNRQPWRFILVTDPDTRAQLAQCGVHSFAAPLRDAPLGVVLVQRPDGYEFDMGRVAQSLILCATTLGLGACPVSLYEEDRARQILNVPTDHGCRFSVALGYPDESAEQKLRRRLPELLPQSGRLPLDSLVYDGRFEVDTE